MNLFIVEDEYWALLELQTLLKEYELNHSIYYFSNALDALEKCKDVKPDLIVTDITMPGMSGLEFIEQLKQIDDQVECILLTVHDTFDYAKKGIDLGVADYILKPIKKELLFKTLNRVLEKIEAKQKDEKDKQTGSIRKLLFQPSECSDEEKQKMEHQTLNMIYILLENWQARITVNQQLFKSKIERYLSTNDFYVSIDERQKLLITSQDQADRLYADLSTDTQVHMAILTKDKREKLSNSYRKIYQMLENNKLFGQSSFINNQTVLKDISTTSLWDTVRLLEKQLKIRQFSLVDRQIRKLINQLKNLKIAQKQLFQFLIDMYYALIYNLSKAIKISIQVDQIERQFDRLNQLSTYDQLEEWITWVVRKIESEVYVEERAPKYLIPKVKKWIDLDYANSITFQQFADDHHVSLSYLSREFKRQTNMTFSEYLTQVRIDKAQDLFKSGIKRTVEVGELVGYYDPKHFRTVFKKVTGMTPKEYKDYLDG